MNGITTTEPSETLRGDPKDAAPPLTEAGVQGLARLKPFLLLAAGLVMAAIAFFALDQLSQELNYGAVAAALASKSTGLLATAVAVAALSYTAMIGYDLSALRHVGPQPPVPPRIGALAAFCGFALSNTMGVGAFTGGAVRWRIYAAAGVQPSQIARILVFVTASLSIGIFFVAALGVLLEAGQMEDWFGLPAPLLRVLAGLCLLAMAGIAVAGRRRRVALRLGPITLRVPSLKLLLAQAVISITDLGLAAVVLWLLLPEGTVGLSSFAALYVVAIAMGALSHLPGGIGVFEAVVLLAFKDGPVPLDQVAAALLLYRAIYFLLPLIMAVVLLTGFELRHRIPALKGGARALRASTRLMPRFLGVLAFGAGAALVMGGIAPPVDVFEPGFNLPVPQPLFEASHLLSSVGGLALLFVAYGLAHRLDGAWWLALLLALGGLVLSTLRGSGFLELSLLALLAVALLTSRRRFDRRARMLTPSLTPGWWLAVACVLAAAVWLLFFAHRDIEYSRQLWWRFELDENAPRAMRVTLATVLLAGAAGLWTLLRPAQARIARPTPEELAHAVAIVEAQDRADANLVRMGDKALLMAQEGDAFIMYGRRGRSWIALYDPVGPAERRMELVWRFVELADAQGGRAAFYQVRPDTLPLYIDAGLQPLKLGEAARVRLASFELKGKARQPLRTAINRAEREGVTFELLRPEDVPPILPELEEVSRLWLEQHKAREKAFSLGAFEPDYVASQPLAVVRGADRRVIAFATLLDTPRTRSDMSVDLMRHRPDMPPGTMDFLFTRLLLMAKEQGYAFFDLGMAPLSGLAAHRLAPIWYRLGGLVFHRGERFYNFRGLRAFKEKFDPVWEPRYLCAAGGLDPWVVLADVAALQSGGLRGVIGK
ncbi:bifunctional lysylphosphatidylglycerol flippase/synthetase MprF [Roseomonas marmotae]|uniref:Phosphatidylglycerol lysyltransferase n=1 Tax=Roseomonas marmotae TaxID=2768161 RepID=A0ABS3KB34_9PROT|nr:bifunctional lysylphosphatidylglycerol flippase/synthetase MprF [Roseomonas marmotae]MBO1074207.1 bifunctional lysylphosphatidylglycerol flippase/synthetase MprF [Roseomonas marmotae]QTI78976.1 bifunctional lysylphosphatidylglycerol flippase/synthetase MprF [Roseomonas marmotae]